MQQNDPGHADSTEECFAAVIEAIRRIVEDECGQGAIQAHLRGENRLADRLWRIASEQGWFGIAVGEDGGGLGLGIPGVVELSRELGRFLAPAAIVTTLCAISVIDRFASYSVKASLLPRLMAGASSVGVPVRTGVGEPAERQSFLSDPGADILLMEMGGGGGRLGIFDLRGATGEARPLWDLTRTVSTFRGEPVLVEAIENPAAASFLGDLMATVIAADSVGIAEELVRRTLSYLETREQFGRKLGSFQALKHRCADLSTEIVVARCLLDQAVYSMDSGLYPHVWTSLAKSSITDRVAWIAQDCLQLHGAIGYTWEYDCHLYLKRARLNQALVESNDVLRDTSFDALANRVDESSSIAELTL